MSKKTTRKFTTKSLAFQLIMACVVTIVLMALAVLFLRLFTRHGREFEMPDYRGQQSQVLTQTHSKEGFIFVVNEQRYEEGATPGAVLVQDPAAGEKVKHGRKVYLTVAASEPPTIKLPELHEIPLNQAKIMIESQGLVLERIIEKPSPYENLVLDVLYRGHSINSGADIKMGEKITLVVGKNINVLPDSIPSEE
ncbi:MAG: PASTA domain-containing protein [Bacteroidales bacterium]|nr:PASTA domain-containing protein [Bacteroidales bacterium]